MLTSNGVHERIMIQYFSENIWLFWLAISAICLILELSSGDFYITCFALGGLAAMAFSFVSIPFWLQVVVFALCSVFSIWLVRPRLLACLHAGGEERPSNADALMGREGKVSEAIQAGGFGRVQIDGDDWKADSAGGVAIGQGRKVRVVGRESIILTVEPAD